MEILCSETFRKILACSLASTVIGCNSSKSSILASDIYGEWRIENVMGKSTADAESETFISFGRDGNVNGCASVNNFFGEYKLKNGRLSFSNVGMTQMLGFSMDIDDAVAEALRKTAKIEIKGNTATVKSLDGKVIMTLKK